MEKKEFINMIHSFYKKNKRSMPWRDTNDPYAILVSEVMLQQTQVPRVMQKYPEFLHHFPSFKHLSSASLQDVLEVWQGMGYNRRAKYLWEISKIVELTYKGILPKDPYVLDLLPGIGLNTAGSIVAFAFNEPVIFIETNIRRVFIHHFFSDKEEIADSEIIPFIEETLDKENPREWYYALMDYGTYLAKVIDNPNKKSKHYKIQSRFKGSSREIRSKIIKALLASAKTKSELAALVDNDTRLEDILKNLKDEQFIVKKNNIFSIK